ncbi:hypothetical protein [Synechococcus sp. RedBA-s]|uniref:hypothetical protein n=1 Tax=Synechococcus sp. RedBA-s TaxID=2823741 RepID=UPI0020CE5E00|nr:hypothetical protein [Synechococcus sp. RedBA-s]MCP9800723.1 hypothetical protein [Synechococcus sp. RedBA-s]
MTQPQPGAPAIPTATARRRTRPTADPYVTEMLNPTHWRWKLAIPQALLAQHGTSGIAQALAAYSPHPTALGLLEAGCCCTFVVFSNLEQASAAAAAIRSL